jgi:type IV pilus assembly protein PilV
MTRNANHRGLNGRAREAGFNIIEVLVALVVLAVGMLGIASLYIVTLRSSGSALQRTQAINLASDLGDRIRANRNAGPAYEGAAAADGDDCLGAAATCTPAEMAAHDLFLWQAQIQQIFPGAPAGTVDVDDTTTPDTYAITVSWREAAEANPLTYTLRMQI